MGCYWRDWISAQQIIVRFHLYLDLTRADPLACENKIDTRCFFPKVSKLKLWDKHVVRKICLSHYRPDLGRPCVVLLLDLTASLGSDFPQSSQLLSRDTLPEALVSVTLPRLCWAPRSFQRHGRTHTTPPTSAGEFRLLGEVLSQWETHSTWATLFPFFPHIRHVSY